MRADRSSAGARRRELSQNFLRDGAAIARFVSALPEPDGIPGVEVGAGDGALTALLAGHFGRLTAYEQDREMAAKLRFRLRGQPGVTVVVGDFLAVAAPERPFHLAGNIPFAATSAIVRWCVDAAELRTATVITQLEYARKRTGDYGRWSRQTVLTWPWLSWTLAGRLPRAAFRPVPAVDAGILCLRRRAEPLLPPASRAEWERAVTLGFGGVGGSLHASLRARYPRARLDAAFDRAGIGPREVVAFVPPAAWVAMFSALERPAARRR